MEQKTNAPTKELTPEQKEARAKKRKAQKQRQRERKAAEAKAKQVVKPAEKPVPVKKSREEIYAERQVEREKRAEIQETRKIDKVKSDGRDTVVVFADTNEAKNIAYKVDEINIISSYARNFMGTNFLSFEKGASIIKGFNESVMSSMDEFLDLAHSLDIGSRRGLAEYKEEARNKKGAEKALAAKMNTSLELENAVEKKEREADEAKLLKAQDASNKAQEVLAKAQEDLSEAQASAEENFEKRYSIQMERKAEEEAKAKEAAAEEARKAKEAAAKAKAEAKNAPVNETKAEEVKSA
jgi:colicin import membrane protein